MTDNETENQTLVRLLESVKDQDVAAFSSLYDFVSSRLFGIQLRILKDRSIAEDALQETFIKIWANAKRYDEAKASPMVWLNSIARNQALDFLRRSKTRADVNLLPTHEDMQSWQITSTGLDEEIARSDELETCFKRLDENTQKCMVGIYCEGYTQNEMSSLMDRPMGTVKSWVRRGLLNLKECLNALRR